MAFLQNKWATATIVVFCWAIATSFTTGYYYYLYTDLFERLKIVPVHVSVSIDYYGNGTTTTFEDVYLFRNATALDALRAVANVTPEYHAGLGTLVTGVNGVFNNWPGAGVGWQYWINGKWGEIAADKQILINGDKLLWNYTTWQGS
ncbi:MAG: DUF4430 domain-containing protein [Thermoproteota archaeon]|nr:DUF4430 domain-containing protein [Thermoproteota archaeon]